MRLLTFVLFSCLTLNALGQGIYLKLVSPNITGTVQQVGYTGFFNVESAQFNLQNFSGKATSGLLTLKMASTHKSPLIWRELLSPTSEVNLEIHYTLTTNNTEKTYLVYKINNSVLNSFKTSETGLDEIGIWVAKYAYEYTVYNNLGGIVSKHSTGWNFINNTEIPF